MVDENKIGCFRVRIGPMVLRFCNRELSFSSAKASATRDILKGMFNMDLCTYVAQMIPCGVLFGRILGSGSLGVGVGLDFMLYGIADMLLGESTGQRYGYLRFRAQRKRRLWFQLLSNL